MRTRDIILYLSYSYFQFRSFLAVLFLATFTMYRAIFDNKITCYFSVDDINELLNINLDFAPCFICSGRCCCHRFCLTVCFRSSLASVDYGISPLTDSIMTLLLRVLL